MTHARRSWLLRPPTATARVRAFCIPYSGTGASSFVRWPSELGAGDIEVCPIQPPGRENRMVEPVVSSFEQLAHDLTDDLEPHLDRPYVLFGHCSAALAAYATAVEIVRRDLPRPAALLVSAQVAPHHGPVSRYFQLSRDALYDECRRVICDLGEVPDADTVDLAVETLEKDIDLHRRYRVSSPVRLDLPITVIGWDQDTETLPASQYGWAELTVRDFRFVTLAGDHFTVLDPPPELFDEIIDAARRWPDD